MKKKINTQQEVIRLVSRISPFYYIRLPTRDKKRGPFLVERGVDPAKNSCPQISEEVFYKMRAKGKLKLIRKVEDDFHSYWEYRINRKRPQ